MGQSIKPIYITIMPDFTNVEYSLAKGRRVDIDYKDSGLISISLYNTTYTIAELQEIIKVAESKATVIYGEKWQWKL